MPRARVYYQEKPVLRDVELENRIIKVFKDSKDNYGSRKIKVVLKKVGLLVKKAQNP